MKWWYTEWWCDILQKLLNTHTVFNFLCELAWVSRTIPRSSLKLDFHQCLNILTSVSCIYKKSLSTCSWTSLQKKTLLYLYLFQPLWSHHHSSAISLYIKTESDIRQTSCYSCTCFSLCWRDFWKKFFPLLASVLGLVTCPQQLSLVSRSAQ